jgi:hypothetical protein
MLRGNKLNSWASIDALDAYPCLTEARLAELPLTSAISGAAARRFVIARVHKLKSLNGSEVRPREREDAERFYLRQIAQEYPEGGLPADAVVYPEGSCEGGAESGAKPTAAAPAAPNLDEYGRPLPGAESGAKPSARQAEGNAAQPRRDQRRFEGYNARPQGDRPQSDRPQGDRPRGDRPQGGRPQGNRPPGDRPQGDRPRGDRPFGKGRPERNEQRGDRTFASTERTSSARDKQPDPNSPFAKLLALKAELESKGKKD